MFLRVSEKVVRSQKRKADDGLWRSENLPVCQLISRYLGRSLRRLCLSCGPARRAKSLKETQINGFPKSGFDVNPMHSLPQGSRF